MYAWAQWLVALSEEQNQRFIPLTIAGFRLVSILLIYSFETAKTSLTVHSYTTNADVASLFLGHCPWPYSHLRSIELHRWSATAWKLVALIETNILMDRRINDCPHLKISCKCLRCATILWGTQEL